MEHAKYPRLKIRMLSDSIHHWFYSNEFGLMLAVFLVNCWAYTISLMLGTSNPWHLDRERLEAGAVAMMSFALTFYVSYRSKLSITRVLLRLSLLPSFVALSVPLLSHYEEQSRLPWEIFLPCIAVLIVGAWIGRMRWFSVCLLSFVLILGMGEHIARP